MQTASTFGTACVGCKCIRSETEGQRSTGRSEHRPVEWLPGQVMGRRSASRGLYFEEAFTCPAPGVEAGDGPSNHPYRPVCPRFVWVLSMLVLTIIGSSTRNDRKRTHNSSSPGLASLLRFCCALARDLTNSSPGRKGVRVRLSTLGEWQSGGCTMK